MSSVYYYSYSDTTGEYIGKGLADIDPEATKKAGVDIYWAPANATLNAPPELEGYKIAVYENNKWVVKDDYRGCYICDELLNIQVVQEIGSLPAGFIVITEAEAQKIKDDPLWYIVDDGELIKNPDYEEQKEQQYREYLSRLAMTKYDFFKFVCQPNNISYAMLNQMVQTNDEIAAAWNLCGHVYRGDETLCTYISQFLPEMTSEVLDEIFVEHGKIINE